MKFSQVVIPLFLLPAWLLSAIKATAQTAITPTASYAWVRNGGGTGEDSAYALAADTSGNVFVGGRFNGTASFGTNTFTSAATYDVFLAKHDRDGNLLWARAAGATGNANVHDASTDSAGNVYICGVFAGSISFGGTAVNSAGGNDMFAAKFDSAGNLLWLRTGGGSGADPGIGVRVDATGNVFVLANMDANGTFGGVALTTAGATDLVLIKYDGSGNTLWARRAGGAGNDYTEGLALDSAGNPVVCGSFGATAVFDGFSLPVTSVHDIFVVKFSAANGSVVWARGFGGSGDENAYGIGLDGSENVYVSGLFNGTTAIGPATLTSAGSYDYFLLKLNASGTAQWARRGGGSGDDRAYDAAVTPAGNVFITGQFAGTANFGTTNLTSAGDVDFYLAEYDTSGNVLYAQRIGGTGLDAGSRVTVDAAGNVYLAGGAVGTFAVGPRTFNGRSGGQDSLVAKLTRAPVISVSPAGRSVLPGGNATFSVTVGGTSPAYQWLFNGQPIPGANAATYTVNSAYLAATGPYQVIITNSFGSVTSRVATLSLEQAHDFAWARSGGGSGSDITYGVAVDAAGNAYAVGRFIGTATFGGTTLVSAGQDDAFVIKYNSAGNVTGVPPTSATPAGTLVAWGDNGYGQTNVPGGLSGVTAIAGGGYHTVALKSDGTVVAWGLNGDGQTTVPADLGGVTAIAGGFAHSVALKSDGTVVAWGRNLNGQATVPSGLSGVRAIAAGGVHSAALKSDGTVVAWGLNGNGQTTIPAGLGGVSAIAAGGSHTVALRSDGTVVAWGNNAAGQTSVPPGLSGVMAIAAGADHTVALRSDGTVVAWGANNDVPSGLSGVSAIGAGVGHTIALRSNGEVVVWGASVFGLKTVPIGLLGVTSIAAGGYHNVALIGTPPVAPAITAQPLSQTASVGQSASFTVTATGSGPLSYQWFRGGAAIAGAMGATLNLVNLTAPDFSSYTVVVSNTLGAVTSAPPAVLTAGGSATVTTFNAAAEFSATQNPNGVWAYGYTETLGGAFVPYDTLNTRGSPWQFWYSSTVPPDPNIIYNPQVAPASAFGGTLAAGQLAAYPGPGGRYTCVRWTAPASGTYTIQASFAGLSVPVSETDPHVLVKGVTTFDAVLSSATATTNYQATHTLAAGDTVQVMLGAGSDGYGNGDIVGLDITITSLSQPPSITVQPVNITGSVNGTAGFSAAAMGSGPLAFQWWFNNAPIPQATNSSLTFLNLTSATVGNYYVVITNNLGSVTSRVATLALSQPAASTWARRLGGSANENAYSVAVDGSGNLYVTGFMQTPGSATFGGTSFTPTLREMFLVKLDSDGSVLWARASSGSSYNMGRAVAVDGAGNVFVTGYLTGSATFGAFTVSASGGGANDAYLAKYDSAGTCLWVRVSGGCAADDHGIGVATDAAGNAYLSGFFTGGSVSFGGLTLSGAGAEDAFVVKYDAVGNVQWARRAGGSSTETANGIGVTPTGEVTIGGHFSSGTATFGSTTLSTAGGYDTYLARLDTEGNWLWAARGGGTGNDLVYGMTVDAAGNGLLAGTSDSPTTSFGALSFTRAGGYDSFVVKYDPQGTPLWERHGTGTSDDQFNTVATSPQGDLYVGGQFVGTGLYGPASVTSAGGTDAVVLRLVPPAPTITTPPQNLSLTVGTNAVLSAAASSSVPVTYQWRKDNVDILNATNATLAFTPATAAHAGQYTVVISSFAGSTTSAAATVTVAAITPVITSATSVTAYAGETFSYQVTANFSPSDYTATGLPAGLTLNPTTGLISGVPAATGMGVATLAASNTLALANATVYFDLRFSPFRSTNYTFTTVAGTKGISGYTDLTRFEEGKATFAGVQGIAVDSAGNLFVTEVVSHTVRKIAPSGLVSALAGQPGTEGPQAANGTGRAAQFYTPSGVAVDSSGNLYVADRFNSTIRKVTPSGVATTLAGTVGVTGAFDGSGAAAKFFWPQGIAVDNAGTVYVADTQNSTIRKITSGGVVTTLAGLANTSGSQDGTGSGARFGFPAWITVDSAGNLYVTEETEHTIRKITAAGVVTTLAGLAGNRGNVDGTGSAARFDTPTGIAVDAAGNLYVANSLTHTIRKVTSAGVVTTLAGSGIAAHTDGQGTAAAFFTPKGVAVDGNGNVYVADHNNSLIRKITPAGFVSTIAGKERISTYNDDPVPTARFSTPSQVAADGEGNLYVADTGNHTIRKVSPAGVVTTLAGLAGSAGSIDGLGRAARFSAPYAVALDMAGNLLVADQGNHTIHKVTAGGVVTTLAGSAGNAGSSDGTGNAARFSSPSGVAVDSSGNIYVADQINRTVRKVTPTGVVSTLAGLAGTSGSTDGTGSAARFSTPIGVAVDSAGNIYVADQGNRTLRKVTQAGVVTTLAGLAGNTGSADGTGSAARFSLPSHVAVDTAGNLIVADTGNHTIRKVTSAGVVTTVAGLAGNPASSDGTGSGARFNSPRGVGVDAVGNIIVADTGNTIIRRVSPAGVVSTLAGIVGTTGSTDSSAQFNRPAGLDVDSFGNLYVADSANATLRLLRSIDHTTYATTEAGLAGVTGSTDGHGIGVRFSNPQGVAVDAFGNVYVADTGNHLIRKMQSYRNVTKLAGLAGGAGSTDATGSAARFNSPWGVVADSTGTLYITDNGSHTVRKVTSAGVVTTLAGLAGNPGSTDGSGSAARFNSPQAVALDSAGNLVVADTGNRTIRKVTTGGVVTTFAGLAGSSGTADGIGTAARFTTSTGLAADQAGNLYVTDFGSHTVRKITPAGLVSTVGGLATAQGSLDGTNSAARFNGPSEVAIDGLGNLLIADQNNHSIRAGLPFRITSQPVNQAAPAGGEATFSVAVDPPLTLRYQWRTNGVPVQPVAETNPEFTLYDLALGDSGMLVDVVIFNGLATLTSAAATLTVGLPPALVLDPLSQTVVDGSNVTLTVTTSGTPAPTVQWFKDGVAIAGATATNLTVSLTNGAGAVYHAVLSNIVGTATSHPATVIAVPLGSQNSNTVIRGYSPPANLGVQVVTMAGLANANGSVNGTGSAARFNNPYGAAVDSSGNVYVADQDNKTVRKVTPTGDVTTLAGLAGSVGSADGTGSAARFYGAAGVAVDLSGIVYVADTYNQLIRKVSPAGDVTTLAGLAGSVGSANGPGSAARFNLPTGVAVDSAGNVYVADQYNHTIRKVTSAGDVTTLAGLAGSFGSANGTGSAARFYNPYSVAVDSAGNVYVADLGNHTVRKVTSNGDVTTLAGLAGSFGSANGTSSVARFFNPYGVAVDSASIVYVADTSNHAIRKVTPNGDVTTLAGSAGSAGSVNGTGSAARFNNPRGLAVDSVGNVFVSDSGNQTIRKMTTPLGVSLALTAPQLVPFGSAATLQVTGTNLTGLTFQWSKDGVPIAGATWGTHTIGAVAGLYSVTIAGSGGTATLQQYVGASGVALTASPATEYVRTGTPLTLTTQGTVLGSLPAAPHWRKNGVVIPGASGPTLTLPSVALSDAGLYGLYDPDGAPLSLNYRLKPLDAPAIVTPPAAASVVAPAGTNFTVAASSTLLAYQWLFNGTPIPGATNATFTLASTSATNDGLYSVTVTNPVGTVTSTAARLTVNFAPTASLINPPTQVVRRIPFTLTANTAGTGPLSYQWRRNGVNLAGANSPTLNVTRETSLGAVSYSLVVSSPYGQATATANISVVPVVRTLPTGYWPQLPIQVEIAFCPTPGISSHTVTEVLPIGKIAQLVPEYYNGAGNVIAYKQGTAQVSLEPTGINEDGVFDPVTGTVKWGLFLDDSPRVFRYTLVPPAGWATPITFSGTYSENGTVAALPSQSLSQYLLHPADNAVPTNQFITILEMSAYAAAWRRSLYWPVAPTLIPADGAYVTRAGEIWRKGEYYTYVGGSAPLCWAPTAAPPGLRPQSVVAPAEQVSRAGSRQAAGLPQPQAVVLSGTAVRTMPATVNPTAPFTVSILATPDANVAYLLEEQLPAGWTATDIMVNGVLSSAGEFDTNFTKVKWGPFFSSSARTLSYTAVPPENASGVFTLSGLAAFEGTLVPITGQTSVTLGPVGPVAAITQQPVGLTVVAGSNVTFSVTATGSGLGYQWRKDANPLSGAVSPTLLLPNVTRSNSGLYSVLVTHSGGQLTSSNAVLRVLVPQRFTQPPVRLGDGRFRLVFGDQDGGQLTTADLANLEIWASTNVANTNAWVRVTNGISVVNGQVQVEDAGSPGLPRRFYRVIEK